MFMATFKAHLQSYPCPKNINFSWNQGFLLGLFMVLQILTGILLGLHYCSNINYAYFSVIFLIREVNFGWSFRYMHSSGASFLFLLIYLHLSRALYYGSCFIVGILGYKFCGQPCLSFRNHVTASLSKEL